MDDERIVSGYAPELILSAGRDDVVGVVVSHDYQAPNIREVVIHLDAGKCMVDGQVCHSAAKLVEWYIQQPRVYVVAFPLVSLSGKAQTARFSTTMPPEGFRS